VHVCELLRLDVEPVEVAVEDQRLAAALEVVGLEQGVERVAVAVQAARNPQGVDSSAGAARSACGP